MKQKLMQELKASVETALIDPNTCHQKKSSV